MSDDIDKTMDWWEAALKGVRGPIDADNPRAGFYRTKAERGSKEFVPVAYWYDSNDGSLRCHKSGRNVADIPARTMWPHASRYPVTAEAYWTKIESGEWPDVDATSAEIAKGPEVDPQADPVASMQAEIDKALDGVIAYQAIESDEQAARGQTLRSTLTTLSGKADKARAAEKEPHLEAGREVDARWQPLVKAAKGGADAIRKALQDYEDMKRAAQHKAQQELEKARREHEAAVAAAAAKDEPAPAAPVEVATNMPAPSTQIRGGSGRAASVSTKPVVTSIDADKVFAHFRTDTALIEFLTRLAQKAIEAGITVEGTVVEQKSVVR